jgi:membrane protein YdbS with pleckstrin-like domain
MHSTCALSDYPIGCEEQSRGGLDAYVPQMRGLNRYLVPGERVLEIVRRHPVALSRGAAHWLLGLGLAAAIGLLLAGRTPPPLAEASSSIVAILATAQGLGRLGAWWMTRYVITDQRVLLLEGILAAKVSAVPLFRVTDTYFSRTVLGRMFNYGNVTLDSPGEPRATTTLTRLRRPVEVWCLVASLVNRANSGQSSQGLASRSWVDPQ